MVQVSRINVGSFDDTEAGLEEAKLSYQRCKAYANAIKKPNYHPRSPQKTVLLDFKCSTSNHKGKTFLY